MRRGPGAAIPELGRVVGWDAAGVVVDVGKQVKDYKKGDEVMFAGVITRQGSYAEYTAVDERLVGRRPRTLNWTEAASVPLCGLTAWEALTEQLELRIPSSVEETKSLHAHKSLLVVAGAGGVGSVAIQIAKKVLHIGHVIATASRPESAEWCKKMGADVIISHTGYMKEQLEKSGFPNGVNLVFNCAETEKNFDDIVPCLATFGKLVCITGSSRPLNVTPLFHKRATLTFELMFARGITNIVPETQAYILNQLAQLIDGGVLHHTLTRSWNGLTAANVIAASEAQDSGRTIGKLAITVATA